MNKVTKNVQKSTVKEENKHYIYKSRKRAKLRTLSAVDVAVVVAVVIETVGSAVAMGTEGFELDAGNTTILQVSTGEPSSSGSSNPERTGTN